MESSLEDILVPITLFCAIATMVGLTSYYRFRSRRELQQTLREAIATGRDLDSAVVQELLGNLQPKNADLRRAAISLAISAGIALFAVGVGEADALGPLLGLAAFPFALGVAYFALWCANTPGNAAG